MLGLRVEHASEKPGSSGSTSWGRRTVCSTRPGQPQENAAVHQKTSRRVSVVRTKTMEGRVTTLHSVSAVPTGSASSGPASRSSTLEHNSRPCRSGSHFQVSSHRRRPCSPSSSTTSQTPSLLSSGPSQETPGRRGRYLLTSSHRAHIESTAHSNPTLPSHP